MIEKALENIHGELKGLREEQQSHGECLARLDERTLQYEKRMDRTDRRAAGIAGITTIASGSIMLFVKSFFGGPSS